MKSRIKTSFSQESIVVRALNTYCITVISVIFIYGNNFLEKAL